MGNQCTPGRLRGPCGSSQHAGLGRSTCPLRSGSRFLLGCFALLFVLLFFFSPATFEGLFLCVYFCLPVQLSLGPFSVPKLGQESFKVMASSSLGWRSGSQVSDPALQPLLELRQLEGRGNIPFLKEQGHSRGEN